MDTQLEMKKEPRALPKLGRRTVVIACAVLLIAAAVVLNLMLFNNPATDAPATDSDGDVLDGEGTGTDTPTAERWYAVAKTRKRGDWYLCT